jgi:hypothetical protein
VTRLAHAAIAAGAAAIALAVACPASHGSGEGEGEGEGEGAAGEGEGEGSCGAVTASGDCNGSKVEFCQDNAVETIDCGAVPFVQSSCDTVSPDWGSDCVAPQGAPCFYLDVNGNAFHQAFCQGDGAACNVTGALSSTCVANSSACSTGDNGSCDGTAFVSCAFLASDASTDGQRQLFDCAVLGGTCNPSSSPDANDGGCYAAPGASCTPAITFCGNGPDDVATVVCPAGGVCPAAAGEGEGEGEGEGGQ